ncbi:MAG: MarR family transcriptional regulator [Clostridia bacterium]|nr:MarR family transcriptional regulator [Clostridia bacterium]
MKDQQFSVLPQPMPEREELRGLPQAPRIIMDISRMLRYRVRSKETEAGVMQSHAARLLMAHLAVCGKMSQLALAEKTHFSTPTVSILLRKMEQEGYVLRMPDERDRRVMLVSLTSKGVTFDREHLNRISENDRRATAGFTPEEEEILVSLLLRMQDNLKER